MPFWMGWVGLPWEWGADPRDGQAACCFRSSQAVREQLGMPWPNERMEAWYRLARLGVWAKLRHDWYACTRIVEEPRPGLLLKFDQPDDSFGVGALASADVAIVVRHFGRLHAIPACHWRKLPLYEVVL